MASGIKVVLATAIGLVAAGLGGPGIHSSRAAGPPSPSDPAPKAAAPEDAEVLSLVRQLGSPVFDERERAERKLRELGPRAKSAVKAALTDPDPEVARRAAGVFVAIRKGEWKTFAEKFRADKDGKASFDHPVWLRFARLVGDGKDARELFTVVIADDRRAWLLDAAEADPRRVGDLYWGEVERLSRKAVPTARSEPGGREPGPEYGDFLTYLYLGSYPKTADHKPERGVPEVLLFGNPTWNREGIKSEPGRRLFALWLANRGSPPALEQGLGMARVYEVPEALPTARRVAADKHLPLACRAAALPVIGLYGSKGDLPVLAALSAEESVFLEGAAEGGQLQAQQKWQRVPATQVRDLAVGMRVVVLGGDPGALGFVAYPADRRGFVPPDRVNPMFFGFRSDEARAAAHAKSMEWLAERPK